MTLHSERSVKLFIWGIALQSDAIEFPTLPNLYVVSNKMIAKKTSFGIGGGRGNVYSDASLALFYLASVHRTICGPSLTLHLEKHRITMRVTERTPSVFADCKPDRQTAQQT